MVSGKDFAAKEKGARLKDGVILTENILYFEEISDKPDGKKQNTPFLHHFILLVRDGMTHKQHDGNIKALPR